MCHNVAMSDSPSSSSKRHQLRFDAGPHGPAFDALCASEGVKPKDMLRRLIAAHLVEKQATQDKPRARVAIGEHDGRKRRRELRLTPSEDELLEKAALRHGSSVRDYIIAIARAHAADARVGEDERANLGKINYQLLAIGRNINQIAHRANAFDGVTQQQLDDLKVLERGLREISSQVHKYLIAGRERWRIICD
jgi:uncharacterized protein (DUF1778 family)